MVGYRCRVSVDCYEGDPDLEERLFTPWLARDMPMQWEMLIENLSDPAHVPFSHHGVQGIRPFPGSLRIFCARLTVSDSELSCLEGCVGSLVQQQSRPHSVNALTVSLLSDRMVHLQPSGAAVKPTQLGNIDCFSLV